MDSEGYLNKGLRLANKLKFDEAIEFYDKALELDPSNAAAYLNKGLLLKAKGKLKQAIECYDKVIQLAPDYTAEPVLLSEFSSTYEKMGEYKKAIACYEKAITADPANADFYRTTILKIKRKL